MFVLTLVRSSTTDERVAFVDDSLADRAAWLAVSWASLAFSEAIWRSS
jgi:hypothetical protein